jgi:hypothetical protein
MAQCGEKAFEKSKVVADRVTSVSQLVAAMIFETACGGLVGAILGWLATASHHDFPYQILIGAGGGACLGLLLGVSRMFSPQSMSESCA